MKVKRNNKTTKKSLNHDLFYVFPWQKKHAIFFERMTSIFPKEDTFYSYHEMNLFTSSFWLFYQNAKNKKFFLNSENRENILSLMYAAQPEKEVISGIKNWFFMTRIIESEARKNLDTLVSLYRSKETRLAMMKNNARQKFAIISMDIIKKLENVIGLHKNGLIAHLEMGFSAEYIANHEKFAVPHESDEDFENEVIGKFMSAMQIGLAKHIEAIYLSNIKVSRDTDQVHILNYILLNMYWNVKAGAPVQRLDVPYINQEEEWRFLDYPKINSLAEKTYFTNMDMTQCIRSKSSLSSWDDSFVFTMLPLDYDAARISKIFTTMQSSKLFLAAGTKEQMDHIDALKPLNHQGVWKHEIVGDHPFADSEKCHAIFNYEPEND